jgi:hypothetical protein
VTGVKSTRLLSSSSERNSSVHSISPGAACGSIRAAARITMPALGTRTLCPSVWRRRKRDGADGGTEAKILRILEPPDCPLQRARRTQHAVRGIIDQHHGIACFKRGGWSSS